MTEDDTFIKLRAMSFEDALKLAIKLAESLPLGAKKEDRQAFADAELSRFGWSYEKLSRESITRSIT